MQEKLNDCPVCGNGKFTHHLTCEDHFLSKEKFSIVKCDHCSFLLTNPRPDAQSIGNYYQSSAYISHTSKGNNLINVLYKGARTFTLAGKVKMINRLTNNKSILDYGCGTGDFLKACKNNGWSVVGLEPDNKAREIASKNNHIQVLSSPDQLSQLKSVGLITLWHVMEHINELNETLGKLIAMLEKDGIMLIAVPNHQSYDAQHYGAHWAAYDVPRHLYHFSQITMKMLLENHGLKINQILPMKLDSFYVSLLSEKYKYSRSNYLKSFINGYKSNAYARKNNNNYSSLIYIASK